MIDDEFWSSVLEPYAQDPARAFILAQTLFYLKQTLKDPKGKAAVTRALELGIEKLYLYTDAHKASFQLYTIAIEGNLMPKDDPVEIVRKLSPVC